MPLSLVSYNLLAPAHAHPERYSYAAPEWLRAERRIAAIRDQLLALDADLYFLQEVEPQWLAILSHALEPRGFSVAFAQKATKPDGCATFFRRRAVLERRVARLYYNDAHLPSDESPTGCLALTVFVEWEGMTLALTNTHLKWDPPGVPPEASRGARQIAQFLRERGELVPAGGMQPLEWLIAGDFNAAEDSPVGSALAQAGFTRAAGAQPTMFAPLSMQHAGPIDHVYASPGLLLEPVRVPAAPVGVYLPNGEHPSDHLPIQTALRRR